MAKCQSCGAEVVSLQNVSVGNRAMDVCARCYASIEKDKAEKEYYEDLKRKECLKRKRGFR